MPRAQKPYTEVTSRHLLRRTGDLENVGASISQGQMDIHVIHGLRLKSKEEREAVLREALGKELLLELPEGQTLAMKADLSLSTSSVGKLINESHPSQLHISSLNTKIGYTGLFSPACFSIQVVQKMGSKNGEQKKQIRMQKNSQLQADDILDEMIPLEHNEKRAETTSLQFWMDTESKFETLIIQPGGMHKFYSRVLKSSSITDILFFLYFFTGVRHMFVFCMETTNICVKSWGFLEHLVSRFFSIDKSSDRKYNFSVQKIHSPQVDASHER